MFHLYSPTTVSLSAGRLILCASSSASTLKGEKQWQTTLGKEWMTGGYPGSRCTPTVLDNLIYVGTGMGNLYCVNRKDGKISMVKGSGR